jgi:hypothetical protein
MQEEKFESLCRRFNVDPVSNEGDIARVFFENGMKTALLHQTSAPALLVGGGVPTIHAISALLKTQIAQEVDFEPVQFEYSYDPDDLTQADVQRLMYTLRLILSAFEEHKRVANRTIAALWEECNPDEPASAAAFHELNNWKASKADIKEKSKQLADIQRKLKKISKLM